jgi:ribosomal-protein-alanine N-acetyltransferase
VNVAPLGWSTLSLRHGAVALRPLSGRDRRAWSETRLRNRGWLEEWEATRPAESPPGHQSYRSMLRDLRAQTREGRCLPFALTVDDRFAGQVTVSNIVAGSALFASVGYWIDQQQAGRGHMPVAVAMAVDYCWSIVGLHRIEIAIRPENAASLRVVEKLGFPEIGYAPRFLHINGDWRDHRIFALCREDVPGGMLRRLVSS